MSPLLYRGYERRRFRAKKGGGAFVPATARSALVLAWDTLGGSTVGPAAQLGSTAGADTNDPTLVGGSPPYYSFGADDYVTFGDVLDSVFTSAVGFSVVSAIEATAADVAAAQLSVVQKDNTSAGQRQFYLFMYTGLLRVGVQYGNGNTNFDQWDTGAAIAAGKHAIGFSFDPTLVRANGSLVAPYLNGAAWAGTGVSGGALSPVADTAQPLQLGLLNGLYPSVSRQRALYVYNRPLTAGEHAALRAELVAKGLA